MTHKTACPECNKSLTLREEHLGKQLKCPACGHQFTIDSFGADVAQEHVEADDVEHLPDAPLLPPDKDFVYGFKDEPKENARPRKPKYSMAETKRRARLKYCPGCGLPLEDMPDSCAHCHWVAGVGKLRDPFPDKPSERDSGWSPLRVVIFIFYFGLAFVCECLLIAIVFPEALQQAQAQQQQEANAQEGDANPGMVAVGLANLAVGAVCYVIGAGMRLQEELSPGPMGLLVFLACCCINFFGPWALAWLGTGITMRFTNI